VRSWLLFAYKVPREPTSGRVYVWRKLRRLGAIALRDAVAVLPATPQTTEQLRWLAAEVEELDGEATLWESRLLLDGQDGDLARRFEAQVEAPYREILAELKRKAPDLAALSRRYQQVLAQDYFHCDLGRQVREALLAAGKAAKAGKDQTEPRP
jgi:hypothetical protein